VSIEISSSGTLPATLPRPIGTPSTTDWMTATVPKFGEGPSTTSVVTPPPPTASASSSVTPVVQPSPAAVVIRQPSTVVVMPAVSSSTPDDAAPTSSTAAAASNWMTFAAPKYGEGKQTNIDITTPSPQVPPVPTRQQSIAATASSTTTTVGNSGAGNNNSSWMNASVPKYGEGPVAAVVVESSPPLVARVPSSSTRPLVSPTPSTPTFQIETVATPAASVTSTGGIPPSFVSRPSLLRAPSGVPSTTSGQQPSLTRPLSNSGMVSNNYVDQPPPLSRMESRRPLIGATNTMVSPGNGLANVDAMAALAREREEVRRRRLTRDAEEKARYDDDVSARTKARQQPGRPSLAELVDSMEQVQNRPQSSISAFGYCNCCVLSYVCDLMNDGAHISVGPNKVNCRAVPHIQHGLHQRYVQH
jgi:hypothetical protein